MAFRLPKLLSRPRYSDPNGLDIDFIRWIAPHLDRFGRSYFSLEVEGISRIPDGPALVVGNHNSGAMFLEVLAFGARLYLHSPDQRFHGLVHDNIIALPVVGSLLHRIGGLNAGHDTAAAAFSEGRKVVVFPGGNREAFRPWKERYEIQFGDRRGFIKLALRHQVPIVPVVFTGGHSGLFILSDNKRLARFLRANRWMRSDTWPLMFALPWGIVLGPLFHVPIPVGCMTRVLEPIPVDAYVGRHDDPAVWDEVYDQVTESMQTAMNDMAATRRKRRWPLRRSPRTG